MVVTGRGGGFRLHGHSRRPYCRPSRYMNMLALRHYSVACHRISVLAADQGADFHTTGVHPVPMRGVTCTVVLKLTDSNVSSPQSIPITIPPTQLLVERRHQFPVMHFDSTSLINHEVAVPQGPLAMSCLLAEANTHTYAMLPRRPSDLIDLRAISVDTLFHKLRKENVCRGVGWG